MIQVLSPRRPDTGTPTAGGAAIAALAYAALAIAMTWPLARGMTRDIPGDLGDPLLSAWTLAWDARHMLAAAAGHVAAVREYWHANIFFPHPLALAYSEHLTMEAIEILPVYAATGNVVLCYNVLFLSTFVLSGLGAYLFTRETAGSRTAGFVAGLAYGFAPYRFGALAHVQVLSSAWMPFTLYALHRYFETRRAINTHLAARTAGGTQPVAVGPVSSVLQHLRGGGSALAAAVAAFVAQALSNGYYLLYFTPIVVLFVAWEIYRCRLARDRTVWLQLLGAGAAAAALVLPFLTPYLEVRRFGVLPRSIAEVDHFAADVYAYLTADVQLRLWGSIVRAWPKPEGSLFPGVTIAVLACIAASGAWRRARVPAHETAAVRLLRWGLVVTAAIGAAVLLRGSLRFDIGPIPFKATDLHRVLGGFALLMAILIAARVRTGTGKTIRPFATQLLGWLQTPAAIMTIVFAFSVVMSFGPHVHSRGKLVDDANLYFWFFRFVPGFDGLRVPARYGMIAALALAALAGDAITRVRADRRRAAGAIAAALIVVESWAAPIPMNYADPAFAHAGLVPATTPVSVVPPIYAAVAKTPADAVLIELPVGEPAFDVRAMFFSTAHWRRLVNGYSGSVPVEYALLSEDIDDLFRSPDRAWAAVARSGATYVLVHEAAYAGDRGPRVSRWAAAHGARDVARAGSDRLFAIDRQGQ